MKISIENCLAFQEKVEIELNKWNLFIGSNNSGKSTLVKVLAFLRENGWNRALFDLERGTLQWRIWNFSDFRYFEYFVNDQTDNSDIRFSFEKEIFGKVYSLSIVLSRSDLNADAGLDNDHKGAEISSIEFKCNNQVLLVVDSERLVIKHDYIIHCSVHSEGSDELESIKKDLLALESKGDIELSISVFQNFYCKSMVEVIQRFNVIIQQPYLRFLNMVSRQLTMELSSTTVIDNTNEPDLDYGSIHWAKDILKKKFNLDLIYRRLYVLDNSGEKFKAGFDWALEQDGKVRSIHSFGDGTRYLLKIVKQLAKLKDNQDPYYESEQNQFSIAIVEPERNMHPDWQVKLINVLLDDMFKQGSHIIIETHSLYILKSIQVEVAKGNLNCKDVSVHEFYRDKGISRVNAVKFDQNGFLSNSGHWKGDFNVHLLNLEQELWMIQQSRIQPN